jgi:rhodanese-related sulfurtransferase
MGGIKMRKIASFICACFIAIGLSGCSCKKVEVPKAQAGVFDAGLQSFGVDKNVNVNTIDKYLHLDNVVYRDMRLLVDSQGYDGLTEASSGMLTATIEGFKVSPLPYIANLWVEMLPPPVVENPVDIGYTELFAVEWGENGEVVDINPNYEESMYVLEEIFPKDKLIFLMCGGGGYAWMTKQILLKLGYDETKVYNIGGFWAYNGNHRVDLETYYDGEVAGAYEEKYYSFYNADYMNIETTLKYLTPKAG